MIMSPTIGELAKALVKAQGSIQGAKKDSTNPHFKSKYADLASIWGACRDALTANGLAVSQIAGADGQVVKITSLLLHTSGEYLGGEFALTAVQNTPQALGSAVTYARRYALASLVGVAPDEDDDGHQATHSQPRPQPEYLAQKAEQALAPKAGINIIASKDKPIPVYDERYALHEQPNIAPTLSESPNELGNYVIPFGKHKSKALHELDPNALRSYRGWLKQNAEETGKPLSGNAASLVEAISHYLASMAQPQTKPGMPTMTNLYTESGEMDETHIPF